MSNATIPNIPVLATNLNDTDLFEKADGPSSGQSQRVTGLVMKSYFGSAIQSQTVALDNATTLYSVAHGLSSPPDFLEVFLVCISDDAGSGYLAGDILQLPGSLLIPTFNGMTPWGVQPFSNATNINIAAPYVFVGNELNYSMTHRNGGGFPVHPTSFNNFQLKFYYA